MRPTKNPVRPSAGLMALLGLNGAPISEPITGITHDSRCVRPGDLYVALPGSRVHGASFAEQAANAGARAILTDPPGRRAAAAPGLPVLVVADVRDVLGPVAAWIYGEPADDLMLLGATGTSGKTTVVHMIDAGLRAAGHATGMTGTIENRVRDERIPSRLTTPEAPELQGLLARMRERGVTAAALEVSSQAMAQGRLGGIRLDVAVFTNLSREHLDLHSTMEGYFAAKARLFTPRYCRRAVVNIDDPYGRRLAGAAAVPTTTFSASGDPAADWRAERTRLGRYGSRFRIVGQDGVTMDASVGLPGTFNIANALAAVVALIEVGVAPSNAVRGVGSLPGVAGRLERVHSGQDFDVFVDYAHKPGAVEAVLSALRPFTSGRLIIVLACRGDKDRGKRPLMMEIAARLADLVVVTTDDPASEDPLAIIDAMLPGADRVPAADRAATIVEPDRAAAIAVAVDAARSGDAVIVANRGHETVLRGDDPFDDRDIVRRILKDRLGVPFSDGTK